MPFDVGKVNAVSLPSGVGFLAGFGPCGDIMSITPPVFADLEEAVEWVRVRLEAGFAPS